MDSQFPQARGGRNITVSLDRARQDNTASWRELLDLRARSDREAEALRRDNRNLRILLGKEN